MVKAEPNKSTSVDATSTSLEHPKHAPVFGEPVPAPMSATGALKLAKVPSTDRKFGERQVGMYL